MLKKGVSPQKMKVIKSVQEMQQWALQQKRAGRRTGLVPTMGYLHDGHISLMRACRPECDRSVVSIFVNPAQFAPNEDLDRYPRDFARDEAICKEEGVDVVFYPLPDEMYGPDFRTYVVTEELSKVLCGRSRPTHFRGVTTVVAKLFNIILPDIAVFGQKDAQQAIIIRRMVADLNFPVQIKIAPIVREQDGLAMSSRNKYLTPEQRLQATVLYRSLQSARTEFHKGNRNTEQIRQLVTESIRSEPLARIDYVELVDAETLGPPRPDRGPVLLALAVFFGTTRLIDNIILGD